MKNSKSAFTLVEIMIVVMLIGLLATIAAPFYAKSRDNAQRTGCVNNLRLIESAKDQWAIATGKANGDPLEESEVTDFIKRGRPVCPTRGEYTFGAVGIAPTCSLGPISDHVL